MDLATVTDAVSLTRSAIQDANTISQQLDDIYKILAAMLLLLVAIVAHKMLRSLFKNLSGR